MFIKNNFFYLKKMHIPLPAIKAAERIIINTNMLSSERSLDMALISR